MGGSIKPMEELSYMGLGCFQPQFHTDVYCWGSTMYEVGTVGAELPILDTVILLIITGACWQKTLWRVSI